MVGLPAQRCGSCGWVYVSVSDSGDALEQPAECFDGLTGVLPGQVLRDRYRLCRLLGRGTHGTTFLAEHRFLNHPCVVKILPHPVDASDRLAVQRMRAEAAAGYRLSDPHVVRVLDFDILDRRAYFVMEYITGIDLARLSGSGVGLSWQQVVRVLGDVACGLAAVHRAGFVHRDVKPANLLLGSDGAVRLGDFGVASVARLAGPEASGASVPGTLAYAAPEIVLGRCTGSCAADLFSLGVTLVELLLGRVPPPRASLYGTYLEAELPVARWLELLPADVPDALRAILRGLLEPDPGRRFGSSDELLDALAGLTSETPSWSGPRATGRAKHASGIVVCPLERLGGGDEDEWLGHMIADHLSRALAGVPGLYVGDCEQFRALLQRTRRGTPMYEARRRAGRLVGAATLVEGGFERAGDEVRIGLRVVTLHDGREQRLAAVSGSLGSLGQLEERLVASVLEAIGRKPAGPLDAGPSALLAAQRSFASAKRAFLRGDYEQALRLGTEALEQDPSFGDALGLVGVACARMGRYEQAVEYHRRHLALAERNGDARMRVEALANLGAMHYFRGQFEAAHDYLAEAADEADRLGLTSEPAQIRNNLGFVLFQLGRPAEAERAFRAAIETHRAYGALVSLIGPYNGLGHVLLAQQRYDEARGYFRRALSLAEESEDRVNVGVAHMNLGYCATLQGRFDEAKHELAVALNVLEATHFWNGLARVYEYMAELNMKLGNFEQAACCAEQRLRLARRHANRRMEEAAGRQKAEALRQAGMRALEQPTAEARAGLREVLGPQRPGPRRREVAEP